MVARRIQSNRIRSCSVIFALVITAFAWSADADTGAIMGGDTATALVVKVKVDRRSPSGKSWDFHNGKPDIYMCGNTSADAMEPRHRKAYNLKGNIEFCLAGHPQKPPMVACNNAFGCSFYLVGLDPKRVNGLELGLYDADVQREHDDTIGLGFCAIGEPCRLGHADVSLTWKTVPWKKLERLEDCRARPKTVWVAGLPGPYTGRPWLGCTKLKAPPIRENQKQRKERQRLEKLRKVPDSRRKRMYPDP